MPTARFGASAPARENLGEISSVEILHRDVEVAAFGAVFVHERHVLADLAELLLKLRAPALGLEDLLRVAIRSGRHQLERDRSAVPAIGGEEHDSHAAASDLVDDLVRSDANALEDRRHHRPGLTGGVVEDVGRTSGASANQLSRLNTARAPSLRSPKVSRLTSWKTFPVTSGWRGFVDDERSTNVLGGAVSHENIVSQPGCRRADGQCSTWIVVNVARQDRGNGHAIDDDRGVRCAGDLDVHQRGLRSSDEDTCAERRRGVADDPEAGKFRADHAGGDDGGVAFRRGCRTAESSRPAGHG